MSKAHFYIVTYGDMGLEVEFFTLDQADEYEAECERVEKAHARDEYDSYTFGEVAAG